ncbi:P-loop ATPase, Sll1717 family [Bradyrhizobium betae]
MDKEILDLIFEDLRKDSRLEVISDKIAQVGDDLDRFMDLIRECHVVAILCTPEYNKRIINRAKSAYIEYKAIVETYESQNRSYLESTDQLALFDGGDPLSDVVNNLRDLRFSVLPILISGNITESVPATFRNKVVADLAGMVTTRWRSTGELRPQKSFRNRYDSLISVVSKIAINTSELRDRELDKNSQEVFNKIFFELKHDSQTLDPATINNTFVKTLEFKRVSSQQSYILIGRKGSGKSTLADFLTFGTNSKWNAPILYIVDDLPLEFLFLESSLAPHQSDQQHVTSRWNLMKFAWEGLFHYFCYEALFKQYSDHTLTTLQRTQFEKIRNWFKELDRDSQFAPKLQFLQELQSTEMARRHAFFAFAVENASKFLASIIENAPTEKDRFDYYVTRNLTPEHFLVRLFGESFLSTFYDILRTVKGHFLIAVDGFDSNFQSFRISTARNYRGTPSFDSRNRFELDWLSGLITATRRCKGREGKTPLAGKVDFCVTIPKDRFIEFVADDRDAYEWESKRVDISWTGIELSILLRKRIEVYRRRPTPKRESALRRLRIILEEEFSTIPRTISMVLNKRSVDIQIFQYLLRHTFWRPRDILFLWGRLISAAEYYRSKDLEFDVETVKLIVSRNLDPIIKLEFIKEFSGSIENLEEVVRKFSGLAQVMTFAEFYKVIESVLISRSISESKESLDHKDSAMRMLYNIGFLGFYLSGKSIASQRFDTKWVFVFNEGDAILSMLSETDKTQIQIVIHPIFIEYLGLKPFRDALVCEFDDEYLVKQEARQVASIT